MAERKKETDTSKDQPSYFPFQERIERFKERDVSLTNSVGWEGLRVNY